MKTINLTKGVETHDGLKSTIDIREPTAGDYIEVNKLPFTIRGNGENAQIDIDFKLGAKWAERLTGLDEILISKMNKKDFVAIITAINEILVEDGDEPGNSPA